MWETKKNPTKNGKYLVAVVQGKKVNYQIGYWSTDLSKFDPNYFEKGECGWYYFSIHGLKTYNVAGWMSIPELTMTTDMYNDNDQFID